MAIKTYILSYDNGAEVEAILQKAEADYTREEVDAAIEAAIADIPAAMVFKSSMTLTGYGTDPTKCSITVIDPANAADIKKGYTYVVTTITGTYTGSYKVGDLFVAQKDAPDVTANWVVDTDWTTASIGTGTGYIFGKATGTTENHLMKWGADGYTAEDAGVTLETTLTDSNAKVPTSKAVLSAIPSVPTGSDATPVMDGTGAAGTSTSWSRSDHVHPSDTAKQDVLVFNTAYDATNNKVATMSDVPTAGTGTPSMDGVGAAGSATTWAKSDHVHPSDTSKQSVIDSTHKLDADLVSDATSTNKFVSASDKQTWSAKQDALVFNTAYDATNNKVATMSDITKQNAGLGNVTNDQQVKAKATGTTQNNLVSWGADGSTVNDAGVAVQTDTLSTQDNTKIPTNKAVASFVNSSVSTNTANFVGTYKSLAELEAVQNPTNNDYGFVSSVDSAILTTTEPDDWSTNYTDYYTKSGGVYTPVTGSTAPTWQANTYWKADNLIFKRYKYVASTTSWSYEYELNNSSFTAAEWATIQSGLSSSDKTKIDALASIFNIGTGLALNTSTNTLAVDNTAVVMGVKGDAENAYRHGDVNITKANIGLGNVTNDAQVKKIQSSVSDNIMTWDGTSGDTPKDSGKSFETTLTANSDTKVPTSKAVADYVAAQYPRLTYVTENNQTYIAIDYGS